MDIAIARGGQVITQVTREEAEAALRSGQLLETDYYWQPGMPAWRPLPLLFAAKVQLPFARPVPKEPSLLDRLLRRRSESECLARYWDLLAVAPDHGAVDPAALDALDAGCGCKVRSRCVRALRQWYSAYVGMVLSDGALASEDRILLTRVATAFGIPVSRAEEELRAAVLLHYGQQLPLILRADQSVEAAVGAVRRLEAALDLPEAQVAALRAPHLEAHFGYLIGSASDANVTPLVARSIRAQAAAFGFDLAAHGDLAARLARAETHWEAEHGELPVIQVGLILGHGEVCHWTSPAELMQMKRVTTGVSYSGPVATIRIMRGLSWRMASYRGQRETSDEVVSLDKGQVFITSKRVIFDGPLKNLVIRHDKVIDLDGHSLGSASLTLAGTGILSGGAMVNNSVTAASHTGTVTLGPDASVGGTGNITLGGVISGGSNGLTKVGGGTLTLSGANTYTGTTAVDEGKLVVNGSVAGNVTVASGATLGGSGTISGDLTVSGAHNPGNSPGVETISGNAIYNDGSSIQWELADNTDVNFPVLFDQILVGGDLTFNGSVTLNLSFVAGTAPSSVDWSNIFWDTTRSWTVFDLTGGGTVNGFGNLSLSADYLDSLIHTLDTLQRGSFSLSLGGLDGNDVLLTYTPVPEPSTYGLMLGGLALAAAAIRRRKVSK